MAGMKELTPSQLRENVYNILDQVVASGKPVSIRRRGVVLQIVPPQVKGRLNHIKKRVVFRKGVNPDSIIHCDWSHEWKPKLF